MFAKLLERHDVAEEMTLGSRLGFMAFHGGTLEKCTDIIASEAAAAAGASYYGVVQSAEDPTHLPSTSVDPAHSPAMTDFFDHVDTVITIHGYGRQDRLFEVLMGGRNRALARHVSATCGLRFPSTRSSTTLPISRKNSQVSTRRTR